MRPPALPLLAAALALAALASALPYHHQFPLATLRAPAAVRPLDAGALSTSEYTTLTLPNLPGYAVRAKAGELCDPSVKQITGYLDVGDDRHFFFWFFESKRNPAKDPVTLWLNGGPGCSSATGLLMELGPCRPTKGGAGTVPNPFSWHSVSSVLFLDQPVNVGFSYSDDGKTGPLDSEAAAKDVYAFLLVFFSHFSSYAPRDFHVAGESYAGHYIPAIGAVVVEGNKGAADEGFPVINLRSIAIGNGLVDPFVQYSAYPEMACAPPGYAPVVKDPTTCATMRSKVPTCLNMIKQCYKYMNRLACVPASFYCNSALLQPYTATGQNPYDVRSKCSDGNQLCYDIMNDIEAYMNRADVKEALGVGDIVFKSCNTQTNIDFNLRGDWMRPYVRLIPKLLDTDGVRVLIYAGDADFICNWIGNKAWALELDWSGKAGFAHNATDLAWSAPSGAEAGEWRTWGNFTFVRVFGAGHMVPYDQPEAAYDMYRRWISGKKFSKPSTV